MVKTTLQTHYKSYSHYLPFGLIVVFKRKGIFNEMVVEAAKKYPNLKLMGCDSVKSTVVSFVYSPENTSNIYLFATDELTVDVLMHECVHVVMRIFESIGSEVSLETEEFFAYLQEMVFRDILSIMKKEFSFTPKMLFMS